MFSFAPAILGDVSAFTITSPDLESSLKYYQLLGFSELYRASFPFPWIQISDGQVLIMLRESPEPYIALTYYVREMDSVLTELRSRGVQPDEMPTPDKMIRRYVLRSPDAHILSLVSYVEGFAQPAGPSLLQMAPQDYANPSKYTNRVCGVYGEYALPVRDLNESLRYWELLGMKCLSKRESPYPWAILSDGLSVIGLHQSTRFDSPRITYFSSDRTASVQELKVRGLELGDNAELKNCTLRTPEGQYINLFSF